jgi:hypothetical protein
MAIFAGTSAGNDQYRPFSQMHSGKNQQNISDWINLNPLIRRQHPKEHLLKSIIFLILHHAVS